MSSQSRCERSQRYGDSPGESNLEEPV